ncbi:HYR domain [Desmophyllum pertusum]|uniref:HYR domain n=1 Tax=Desmophyllum pertusum TaxID=174260 RepID=A0A9W9YPB0_9CNID|nr:HYR domain [Desmophyllum pertusum]
MIMDGITCASRGRETVEPLHIIWMVQGRASNVGRVWSYSGGGTLIIANPGSFPYEMSGFNIWNKVLLPDEVKELATSCLRGLGNVKTWMDFLGPAENVRAKKGSVIRPSACKSPQTSVAGAFK